MYRVILLEIFSEIFRDFQRFHQHLGFRQQVLTHSLVGGALWKHAGLSSETLILKFDGQLLSSVLY